MGFWMKSLFLLVGVFVIAGAAFAGSLEPSYAPESTSSYTMHDLFLRFTSGEPGAQKTFTGPEVWHGGGSGPMETVDDVMGVAPVKDDAAGATAAEVKSGKRFWGLTGGEWGPQTGTFVNMPANSPKTGQIISYDTRDDGALQRGAQLPSPRFTDNGDGTVTDNKTGLIWLKNANCFDLKNWAIALNNCNTLASGSCGLSDGSTAGDWRLPTIRELRSLVNYAYSNPAISNAAGTAKWSAGNPFHNVQTSAYWSSTTIANSIFAWVMNMSNGIVAGGSKGGTDYIWPVRGGQ